MPETIKNHLFYVKRKRKAKISFLIMFSILSKNNNKTKKIFKFLFILFLAQSNIIITIHPCSSIILSAPACSEYRMPRCLIVEPPVNDPSTSQYIDLFLSPSHPFLSSHYIPGLRTICSYSSELECRCRKAPSLAQKWHL